MSAKVKYHIIYRYRTEYPVAVMCKFFGVSRSGCYAFVHRLGRPEQDAALAEVIAKQRERSFRMNRDFHASKPNSKWVTDISYIHTRQGVLYLSMIRDLYDNSIVACKTGTEQTVNLVLDTIRLAMKQEKKNKYPPAKPGVFHMRAKPYITSGTCHVTLVRSGSCERFVTCYS